MASSANYVNFALTEISYLFQNKETFFYAWLTPPKQGNGRKTIVDKTWRSYRSSTNPRNLEPIMPCLTLFDAKLRHLASRESEGGRSRRSKVL